MFGWSILSTHWVLDGSNEILVSDGSNEILQALGIQLRLDSPSSIGAHKHIDQLTSSKLRNMRIGCAVTTDEHEH